MKRTFLQSYLGASLAFTKKLIPNLHSYKRVLTCSFGFVGGRGLHLYPPLKNHCNATIAIQENSERQKEVGEHYDQEV